MQPAQQNFLLKNLNENKWSWAAAGALLCGLLSARGGLQTFVGMLRFLLPVLIGIFIFRVVKKKVFGAATAAFRNQMAAMMQGQGPVQGPAQGRGRRQDPITLCSKCGSYLTAKHVCK